MHEKEILLASPRGFCAGVRRAIEMIELALASGPSPLYCLKEIVHNRQIVDDLRRRGVVFVDDLAAAPAGATVVFSAHGVAPSVRAKAGARGFNVIDATCPFVNKVHSEVRRFCRGGFSVLLIGHRRHDEVIGVVGEAPEHVQVVESCVDAEAIRVNDPARVAVVTQTTLSVEESEQVMTVLRRRFPALQTPETSDICYATVNRQQAVRLLATRSDAVLVLGSRNSSNSRRLVEVARSAGRSAWLISEAADLDPVPLDGVRVLGLTAGASTPESFIATVVANLQHRGFCRVTELCTVKEDLHFALPRQSRAGDRGRS